MSEYATLAWVRKSTSIPVARVLSIYPNSNPLRFEWMIQTYMPGTSLAGTWYHPSNHRRQFVVRQMACFRSEIFGRRHRKIGSLYNLGASIPGSDVDDQSFPIGKIATAPFFARDRVDIASANRGPFDSSREWLTAQLEIVQLEYGQCLEQL